MKKKLVIAMLSLVLALAVTGCDTKVTVDVEDATVEVAEVDAEDAQVEEEGEADTEDLEEEEVEAEAEDVSDADTEDSEADAADVDDTDDEADNAIAVTATTATMYAKTACNVQSGDSTAYDKLGTLKLNDTVEVTGICDSGWYQISFNGSVGYVAGSLLVDSKVTTTASSDTTATTSETTTASSASSSSSETSTATTSSSSTSTTTSSTSTPVSYDPNAVVATAIALCQAQGMITTQDEMDRLLAAGTLSQEDYDAFYPYGGLDGTYLSVFVNVDLNKAHDILGAYFTSEYAVAHYVASMTYTGSGQVFNIIYAGTYTSYGETYYEFRCLGT